MRSLDWKEVRQICEHEGCVYDRQKGDHYIMTKPGLSRPVVIPRKRHLKEDIVLGIGRTLGLNRKQILERLENLKQKKKSKGASV